MTGRAEIFYEICIFNGEGFTERDYFQVRDIVTSSKPDYWILFQPDTISCYFRINKDGQKRGDRLISEIRKLKKSAPLFQSIGVAGIQQEYLAEVSFFGRIKTTPIGFSMELIKNAKNDALT